MSENLRTHTKALYGFDATVNRTPADAWSNASPCEGWTAADVVAHNVGMNDMIAGFCQGTSSRQPSHDLADDPAAEWQRSFDGLLAALDSEGALQTVAGTPWGELPVDKFLGFAWVDPLIHTWDLALATGQEPVMDSALVARAAKQLERAGDSLVGPGRFKPPAEEGVDSSAIEHLAALAGRSTQA